MNKILVIQTASIGDVILSTPVLESLHRCFPEATIMLLVKKGMEGLFTGHPFLSRVLTWDKSHRKNQNLLRLIRDIRKERFDAVYNIQRFGSTGLITALSGAKTRAGFKKNPFSFLFTEKIDHRIGDNTHEAERNLLLIKNICEGDVIRPAVYPTPSDNAKMISYKSGNYYTISPASLWFTKQYPVEKWIEFLSYVDDNAMVYCLGASGDQKLCEEIISKSGRKKIQNLAGKLSFLESASLMKDAKMNFTNDSAPLHLASAVNAPVTAIFCSTVPAFGFGPLSDNSSIAEIQYELYCRPCGLHGYKKCPEGHFKCAYEISVEKLASRL